MLQKTIAQVTKPVAPHAAAKPLGTEPVKEQDSDRSLARPKKAAAEGPSDLKSPALAASVEQPRIPEAAPPKALAPLAAVWPDSALRQGASRPAQTAGPKVQGSSAAVTAPKASPAPATSSSPKPTPRSHPPTSPEKPAVAAQASIAPAPRAVKVSFALFNPEAKRVSLCGEFNEWSPDATPMKRREGGRWEADLALRPGRYQYKFVIDGQWLHDPAARENVPNQYGSLNSVMEVRA